MLYPKIFSSLFLALSKSSCNFVANSVQRDDGRWCFIGIICYLKVSTGNGGIVNSVVVNIISGFSLEYPMDPPLLVGDSVALGVYCHSQNIYLRYVSDHIVHLHKLPKFWLQLRFQMKASSYMLL